MTQIETSQTAAGREAWLGHTHGYRIAGDVACLNAELALAGESSALAQNWALQLWACDKPYQGGVLQGTKVAEAPVEAHAAGEDSQPQHLYAETFARLPTGDREYAMVLVLASRSAGAREQVHDFANYPELEHFNVPALRGDVSFDPEQVTLRVQRIENPRSAENLSGTLALELWALDHVYRGEQFAGTALGGVELGRLAGRATLHDVALRVDAATLAQHKHLTVMLREWTATGYVTRDYRNLAVAPAAELAAVEPVGQENAAPPPLAAVAEQDKPRISAPASTVPAGRVSVQHATLDALAAVPGLSRKLAQEIIKARPIRSLEELKRVRGIGDKTLRKLRAVLTL